MRHYWLTSDAPDLPGNAFQKAFGRNRPATLEGGKGGGSPAAPDPYVTAAATTQTNNATAAFNKALNLNNYTNPFGSQQTTQTGTDPTTGAPIYNTTLSANPQLQNSLYGLLSEANNSGNVNPYAQKGLQGLNTFLSSVGNQAQGVAGNFQNYAQGALGLSPQFQSIGNNIGNAASGYRGLMSNTGALAGQYGNLNNQYAGLGNQLNQGAAQQAGQQGANASYQSSMGYLTPQFQQQQESTNAQLANQGLAPGSEAWNNAQGNLSRNQTFQQQQALNQAQLTGSQIGAQNLQNQISGINTQAGLLGAQGSNLGAQAGLYGQQAGLLGNQIGAYGQQMNALNGMSGLYGLAGQLGSGQLSALGTNLNATQQQAGLYGQQVGISQLPYQDIGSIASMIPGYSGTGQSAAAPADIAGNINNQYQSQLANHNADVQSTNSTIGTIGTVAGMAAMAF